MVPLQGLTVPLPEMVYTPSREVRGLEALLIYQVPLLPVSPLPPEMSKRILLTDFP